MLRKGVITYVLFVFQQAKNELYHQERHQQPGAIHCGHGYGYG